MWVVGRKLSGILGAIGNWGVIFAIAGFGAATEASFSLSLENIFLMVLGIGSVLALMVSLTSLAYYYNVPIKEKAKRNSKITIIVYVLLLISTAISNKSNSGDNIWGFLSFILLIAFIVLLIKIKRDVYIYTAQASSIFNFIAKIYARTSRRIANPHGGGSGNVVVVMDQETYVQTGIIMMIFAFLLAIVIWFTLEPIAWILWGLTGK